MSIALPQSFKWAFRFQIPTHVDGDLVLCHPLYRIQELLREFYCLLTPIQIDHEDVHEVRLTNPPNPHQDVPTRELGAGCDVGLGVVVDDRLGELLPVQFFLWYFI